MDIKYLQEGDLVKHSLRPDLGVGVVEDIIHATIAYVRWASGYHTWPSSHKLVLVCRACYQPKAEHDETTGKCLFGAGVWTR